MKFLKGYRALTPSFPTKRKPDEERCVLLVRCKGQLLEALPVAKADVDVRRPGAHTWVLGG